MLDRMLWPAGVPWPEGQVELLSEITKADANALLRHWQHPLGEWRRPFGAQYFGLAVDGEAAAVAVSGSTVGARSAGYPRREVVELGRIARSPQHPDHARDVAPVARLPRAALGAPTTGRWRPPSPTRFPARPGTSTAWTAGVPSGSSSRGSYSGGYSNPSVANNIGDGLKRLYVYPYNVAPFLTNTPTGVSGEAHGHQIKPR